MNIELDKAVHNVDLTEPTELIKQLEAQGYVAIPSNATCGLCKEHIYPGKGEHRFKICKKFRWAIGAHAPACTRFQMNHDLFKADNTFDEEPSNSRELKAEVNNDTKN